MFAAHEALHCKRMIYVRIHCVANATSAIEIMDGAAFLFSSFRVKTRVLIARSHFIAHARF